MNGTVSNAPQTRPYSPMQVGPVYVPINVRVWCADLHRWTFSLRFAGPNEHPHDQWQNVRCVSTINMPVAHAVFDWWNTYLGEQLDLTPDDEYGNKELSCMEKVDCLP